MHLPEQKHTFTNHLFIPPSEHHRPLRNDFELTSCHVVHLVLRAFGGVTRRKSKSILTRMCLGKRNLNICGSRKTRKTPSADENHQTRLPAPDQTFWRDWFTLSSCCRRGWGCPVYHLRLRSFGKNFVWIFKALTWGGRNSWSLINLHDCNYTSDERCGTFRGGYM